MSFQTLEKSERLYAIEFQWLEKMRVDAIDFQWLENT